MVYVRVNGAAEFEGMGAIPAAGVVDEHAAVQGSEGAVPEAGAIATVDAPVAALATPPRGAAVVAGSVGTSSVQTTPSCASPRKRICQSCNAVVGEDEGPMSVASMSVLSTPVASPPMKCAKCVASPATVLSGSVGLWKNLPAPLRGLAWAVCWMGLCVGARRRGCHRC